MTKRAFNITANFVPLQFLQDKVPAGETVDLNKTIQTVLKKYTGDQQNSFILRCDKLPVAKGKNDQLFRLFDALIQMIVNHPPIKSKLFLYIKCKEENIQSNVIDLRMTRDVKLFKIDFHTNITTTPDWETFYQIKLKECTLLASQNGGGFSFYPISNTGCLFSILLPGKI